MKDLRYFDPHRRATWLELFFDLIIVVALRDAGEILSETHDGHIAPQQFLHFVLVFLPLWWIWAGHTIYANRFDTDSRQHRLSTLLIMFLMIVISAQILGARDHVDYAWAVACYCGARLIIAAMYFVSRRKHHDRGGFATQVGTVFAVGAAISLSSILLEPPWSYLVFYAGIVFDMAALVLLNRRLHVVPAHTSHLVERVGLLTIIMLGESVISISAALADIAWNQSNVIAAVSGFVMVSAIWWIYYDSFYLLERRRFTTGPRFSTRTSSCSSAWRSWPRLSGMRSWTTSTRATSVNWSPPAPYCSFWASSTATTWRSPSCGLTCCPTPPPCSP